MYERFSERARKVLMQLAHEEAQRLNHEYVGTEHILLGIVKEGSGVGATLLKTLDLDLRTIRMEIEKVILSGPDPFPLSNLPQTPRVKKVIEYAIDEARHFKHNCVGTEHLLLGLLREQEGVAAQVLVNLGIKLEAARESVLNFLGHRTDSGESGAPLAVETRQLPADVVQALKDLDAQIEPLKRQKEAAIAVEDFEKAAMLRDRVDKLEMKKRALIREWRNKA